MEKSQAKCPQLNKLEAYEIEKTVVLAGFMSTVEVIALKPVVENLGLDWSGQLKRLKREDPTGQLWTFEKFVTEDKKSRDMVCMTFFNFQDWLHDIIPSENMNVQLWTLYKKRLIITLLELFRASLDEVVKLRIEANEYAYFRAKVDECFNEDILGSDMSNPAKVHFKNKKKLMVDVRDMITKKNSPQLTLLLP